MLAVVVEVEMFRLVQAAVLVVLVVAVTVKALLLKQEIMEQITLVVVEAAEVNLIQ